MTLSRQGQDIRFSIVNYYSVAFLENAHNALADSLEKCRTFKEDDG